MTSHLCGAFRTLLLSFSPTKTPDREVGTPTGCYGKPETVILKRIHIGQRHIGGEMAADPETEKLDGWRIRLGKEWGKTVRAPATTRREIK